MIWRLLPAKLWPLNLIPTLVFIAGLWALFSYAPPPQTPPAIYTSSELTFLLLFLWMLGQWDVRATHFHLGLPIHGRKLMEANMLSRLISIWFPSLLSIWLVARQLNAASPQLMALIAVASVFTLAGTVTQSFRLHETKPTQVIVGFTRVIAVTTAVLLASLGDTSVVIAGCLASAAVLFAVTWVRTPPGFLLASESRTTRRAAGESQSVLQHLPWVTLMRALCPGYAWTTFLFLWMVMRIEPWIFSAFAGPILMANFRRNSELLLALPISSSKLLLARIIPGLFMALTASYGARPNFGDLHETPRLLFIRLAVITALFLIHLSGFQFYSWKRVSWAPRLFRFVVWVLPSSVLSIGCLLLPLQSLRSDTDWHLSAPLSWFSAHLPANSWEMAGIVVAVLAGLYGLNDWQTREQDRQPSTTLSRILAE
ncbi:MAG: hypothetical protein JOZ62_23555 [Acidobacteriaceae bacterium]|nr:hypothetical protein [Acidobacteriaceae bacterium]